MSKYQDIRIPGFTDEQVAVVLEAAWFALRHHYHDLAEYLDASDESLEPLIRQMDGLLGNDQ